MLIADTKKSEENISNINNKVAVSSLTGKVSVAVVLASLLSLAACGGGGGSATPSGGASTGGGTTTGGGSAACVDVPGEPDIMGPITFTPATINPVPFLPTPATAAINIPVDADTAYVGVVLSNPTDYPLAVGAYDNSSGVDFFVVATQSVQTLHIPVIVTATTATAGDIYPQITLCSVDINACKQIGGSGGVAVSYATIKTPTGFVFTRFKNFAGGSAIIPTTAQLANPTLACVPPQALAVVPTTP